MHSKWASKAVCFYYTIGILYYLYEWLALIGLVGVFASLFSGNIRPNLPYFLVPAFLILPVTSIIIWLRKSKYVFQGTNPYLKNKLVEICYSIVDESTYKYSRKVIIKALQDGVTYYKNKFAWTGSGTISPFSADAKMAIGDDRYSHNKYCQLDFESPLNKNSVKELCYSLDLKDPEKKAKKFLSQTIHAPIDKLVLRVHFLNHIQPQSYQKQVFMTPASEIPIWQEQCAFELDSKEAVWEIKRPRLGCAYRITW